MEKEKIKVLIADDSPVVREVLKDMISGEADLEVIGEAKNGREAVDLAESLKPDMITMDVIMPVMNGLEAVQEIMAYTPAPIMVFSSVVDDKEMDVAFQSIARGALEVMEKPKVTSGQQYDDIREDFLAKIRMLSRIQVLPHLGGKRRRQRAGNQAGAAGPGAPAGNTGTGASTGGRVVPPEREIPPPEVPEEAVVEPVKGLVELPPMKLVKRKIMAMGASTGGPKALVQIFSRIPRSFPMPVLVVQHIAKSFAPGLVNWLNRESEIQVALAEDKSRPQRGMVYLAPTGTHMIVERGVIRLSDSDPVNSCKPSADVLFNSIAESMGSVAIGVLLTGMGRDGAEGLRAIRQSQGMTLVQDQKTSVIFGMPRAAIELDAAHEVVPLFDIPEAIVRYMTK